MCLVQLWLFGIFFLFLKCMHTHMFYSFWHHFCITCPLTSFSSIMKAEHNLLIKFNRIHPELNNHCRIVTDNMLKFLDITFNFPLILNLEFWGNPLLLIVSLLKTCHPSEHKLASVRYLLNHTNSFSLSLKQKERIFQNPQHFVE